MRHWFTSQTRRNPKTNVRRAFRPTLEALEDRRLLAAPVINPIAVPLNIPALKTLIVPVSSQDPSGGSISYNITSDNPAVTVQQHTTNTNYLILDVAGFGQMEFQLFNDITPDTATFIAGLVKSEFYNGLTFHRVVPNFVIQGGDPAGTGSGNVGFSFNDEYNANAIYSGSGQLAMANSGPDTNGSQFFVTIGAQRGLDFNNAIFGQLVRGFNVLQAIDAVPTDTNNKPLTPVVITDAKIVQDNTDTVFTLSTTAAAGATANLTITATASDGGTTTETVPVSVIADVDSTGAAINDPPFIGPVTPMVTPVNTPLVFNLPATNIQNSPLNFEALLQGNSTSNATVTVSGSQVTVTPNSNFEGQLQLLVGVEAQGATARGTTTNPFDTHLMTIGVGDQALTGGSTVTFSGTEGTSAASVKLATFTDPDLTAVAGDYTATINWGDGTPLDTTSATITGSAGNFSVAGTHTYQEAGTFPVQVVVTDAKSTAGTDEGGAAVTIAANATIGDAALTAQGGSDISGIQGTATGMVAVASFTDADPNGKAGDYTATIDWGDDTTSAGTVQAASGGGFTVVGNHQYNTGGSFTINTSIVDVVTAGDVPPSTASAASTATITSVSANQLFVDRVFVDLLGRAATASDRAVFGSELDSGMSRTEISEIILNSTEGIIHQVQNLYMKILNRPADAQGLTYSMMFLQDGGSIHVLEVVLLSSTEFFNNISGGTDNGYLSSLYSSVLGRAIESGAQSTLGTELGNSLATRQDMAVWVLESQEGQAVHEENFYTTLLDRTPSSAEVNNLATLQQNGASDEAITADLTGSAEYLGLL